jgi:hypothetical protein
MPFLRLIRRTLPYLILGLVTGICLALGAVVLAFR